MTVVVNGVIYEFTRGSDIIRDGMFLEVSVKDTNPLRQVAEIFYSDATAQFFLSCFESDVPLQVLEELIRIAHRDLPPIKS
ncbi:hypothetical protein EV700_0026 [Fluviicoccus keumensis]|uniref:Uncharacterized protein n=1 Tax=Fluviicoccus keumensis TaxID=1435465 RepID=A0A4Q7ZDV9_9GAMM|nr:hypothetical protein [Fluviicoccus keumensis]RZU48235.1 hypothetical protein EV700_0026 [Fluviicoccus keumensis]